MKLVCRANSFWLLQVKAAARGLPTDLRLALRELEALRREREALAAQLRGAETQVERPGGLQKAALVRG